MENQSSRCVLDHDNGLLWSPAISFQWPFLTSENIVSRCTVVSVFQKYVHELRITNQVMYLGPQRWRRLAWTWFQELFAWESIILSLPRIQHSRYQVGLDAGSEAETTYKNLLTKLPAGPDAVEAAYSTVEKLMSSLNTYVGVSLLFFGVTTTETSEAHLGGQLALWHARGRAVTLNSLCCQDRTYVRTNCLHVMTACITYRAGCAIKPYGDLQPEQIYDKLKNNMKSWMTTLGGIK